MRCRIPPGMGASDQVACNALVLERSDVVQLGALADLGLQLLRAVHAESLTERVHELVDTLSSAWATHLDGVRIHTLHAKERSSGMHCVLLDGHLLSFAHHAIEVLPGVQELLDAIEALLDLPIVEVDRQGSGDSFGGYHRWRLLMSIRDYLG